MGNLELVESPVGDDTARISRWLQGEKLEKSAAWESVGALRGRLDLLKQRTNLLKDVELSDHVLNLVK